MYRLLTVRISRCFARAITANQARLVAWLRNSAPMPSITRSTVTQDLTGC
jgi:hypothetical protein